MLVVLGIARIRNARERHGPAIPSVILRCSDGNGPSNVRYNYYLLCLITRYSGSEPNRVNLIKDFEGFAVSRASLAPFNIRVNSFPSSILMFH